MIRRRPVLVFLARRVLAGALTLLVASALIFAATEYLPGDIASAVLGKNATPSALAEVRAKLGVDRSAPALYLDWLGGFVTGDLGDSAAGLASGADSAPVWEQIREPIRNSAILAGITVALLVPLTFLLGVIAAARAGRPVDHVISTLTLVAISLPEFVIGSLLVLVFFVQLDLLPPVALVRPGENPLDQPRELVLPALTLLATALAWTTRLVRAGMVEALASDHIEQARLNGFRERRVVWRYALRNALAPSVQVFAQSIQYLVGGVILTEVVFGYNGLGKELVDAVVVRDVRSVQSMAMLIAIVYIAFNIAADLIVALLVPRIRTAIR